MRRNYLTMWLHPYGIVNSCLLFKGTDRVGHNEELEHKVTALNEEIKRSFQNDVIDNSNLDETCVNKGGLHLSRKGTIHLAMNYKQMLSDL